MKAVVMAGGEGSRLRPLTLTRPKPMLPVANRPLLGHILHLLRQHGIVDVVVTLQYMATHIQDYYGDGASYGMNIEYVIEEMPLGTAGSVRNASAHLATDEPFLVISGDALTDFDLSALIRFHRDRRALLTVALYSVPDPLEYGVINVNDEGRISQFLEKPSWGSVTSDTVNTGIYVLQSEVLARISAGRSVDWSQDVFPAMLARNDSLYGYVASGYWCDIGTLSEYRRANADLLNGFLDLGPLGERLGGGIWAGKDVEIAPDAQIFGPVYLGDEVQVKSGVVVHGPVVIRDYTILDNRAQVERSIVWRNCYIGEGVELHGAVVGRQCSLMERAILFEGAVIGDRTVIGKGAVIRSDVKIWPGKEVESGATVNHSIIWGSQGRRILFGRYGVTGVVNVDLTPDFVARLGAAYGSVLPKGSLVTINRDPHRSPRMIKRAMISGLPSAGNNVLDLGTVPIPVARHYTRTVGAAGGVHVRLSPYDDRVVDIRFIGGNGLNLSREEERAIQRVFFREDFRRAYLDDIGTIAYARDVVDVYALGYLSAIDSAAVQRAGFRVVVDYAHAPVVDVLPDLLDTLRVDVVPLNARVEAGKTSLPQEEFWTERAQLATITGALRAVSLGVRLDAGGEKIFVVDDTGASVPDDVLAAAMAALALQTHPGCTLVVTADQSDMFEKLAERYGGSVLRCPIDAQALMLAATADGVAMACDGKGSYVFPALHPAIDGLFALGKLLEFLALRQVRLSNVVAGLPMFSVAHGEVEGAVESKGRVMRCLMERFARVDHEILDGIKLRLDASAWVMIYPDDDQALFHVAAEAGSMSAAQDLVREYAAIVEGLVADKCDEGAGKPHDRGQ